MFESSTALCVISYAIFALGQDKQHTAPVYRQVTLGVMLHWIQCNVYTQSSTTVQKKIKAIVKEYRSIKNYPQKKYGQIYWTRVETFVKTCRKIFDIKGSSQRIKDQERLWGVKMTDEDENFHENQCKVPQVGYCSTFIGRKWQISNM